MVAPRSWPFVTLLCVPQHPRSYFFTNLVNYHAQCRCLPIINVLSRSVPIYAHKLIIYQVPYRSMPIVNDLSGSVPIYTQKLMIYQVPCGAVAIVNDTS